MTYNLKQIFVTLLYSAQQPVKLRINVILLRLTSVGFDAYTLVTIFRMFRLRMKYKDDSKILAIHTRQLHKLPNILRQIHPLVITLLTAATHLF